MQIDALVDLLREPGYHSGNDLAKQLGISRARVWQMIKHLESLGLPIWSVRGRGYRVAPDVSLLHRQNVLSVLSAARLTKRIENLQLVASINSTNAALLGALSGQTGYAILSSEHQYEGRGRQGRTWYTPMASNLACSFALASVPLVCLPGLSLSLGVAIADMLRKLGLAKAMVKWPNDIYLADAKVAGILVELRVKEDSSARLVIGVGMNVNHSLDSTLVARPTTHVNAHLPQAIERSTLLAYLIQAVVEASDRHLAQGMTWLHQQWPGFDYLLQREVRVHTNNAVLKGQAQGIDDQGRLMVLVNGQCQVFDHGEVSVRV